VQKFGMPLSARVSTPADRDGLTSLLAAVLQVERDAPTLDPAFQHWKYWAVHPLVEAGRSHILEQDREIVAHGCAWPIELHTAGASLRAFHLVDWAAQPRFAGAGVEVLRQCTTGHQVMISLGGASLAKRLVSAMGFKPHNRLSLMWFPVRPWAAAARHGATDWKLPARAMRNAFRCARWWPRLPRGWRVVEVLPEGIPDRLWPVPGSRREAVGHRSAQLLSHVLACPLVERGKCLLLERNGRAVAYLFMVQVGGVVRLADFGPARLDAKTCRRIAVGAAAAARSMFPGAHTLVVATSEEPARAGFLGSGYQVRREEPIRVLKLDDAAAGVDRFRLTLLDWDAAFL
jgi:hypothetical protein